MTESGKPTISNEAIADRLAVLKATLADIATSWYDRERRSSSQRDPALPEVGSHFWDYDLAFEKDKRDHPDLYRMLEEGTVNDQEDGQP